MDRTALVEPEVPKYSLVDERLRYRLIPSAVIGSRALQLEVATQARPGRVARSSMNPTIAPSVMWKHCSRIGK